MDKTGYSFTFDPDACHTCNGDCCNGESGNIWVSKTEIESISKFLSMTPSEFINTYLRKVSYRFSIIELKSGGNYSCVFFDGEKNGCTIYEVRPEQCRTFPFWPRFMDHPEEVFNECPGVKKRHKEK